MKTTYVLLITIIICACSKEKLMDDAGAKINLSVSSISFDTLFTTTGSATRLFKIFNPNNGRLQLNEISLRGLSDSYFHFNADGKGGKSVNDVYIEANDSIYVFLTVNIDPNSDTLPFIVSDTLDIKYNGNIESLPVSAWGQNARFLRAKVIYSDTTWTNNVPIVIIGGALVADGVTLKIERGTRIYMHADAPLIIDGTLEAIGDVGDSLNIEFQGDRLDRYYRDLPGSWPGIFFTSRSNGNVLRHVIIKNAYQGIVCEPQGNLVGYKLEMDACIIDNCYDAGIIGISSAIKATNCLVSNCGRNLLLVRGGRYAFTHCTVVSVSNVYVPHKQPVLTLSDYLRQEDAVEFGPLEADFVNCIFWAINGSVEDEVVVLKEGTQSFEANFTNCVWKFETRPSDCTTNGMIENEAPSFVSSSAEAGRYDFRLAEGSRGINEGIDAGIDKDLDGKARTNTPDIGAFESGF